MNNEEEIMNKKAQAYDTAVAIEGLQIRLRNLGQQIANLEMASKVPTEPKKDNPKKEEITPK